MTIIHLQSVHAQGVTTWMEMGCCLQYNIFDNGKVFGKGMKFSGLVHTAKSNSTNLYFECYYHVNFVGEVSIIIN